jgi:hypothetical protein
VHHWKRHLERLDKRGLGVRAVLQHGVCAPAVLMALLEVLLAERFLTRPTAVHIEEQLLKKLSPQGWWLGVLPADVRLPEDLAPLINEYWR